MQVNHFETTKHGGKKLDQNSELLPSSYKTRSDVSVTEIEEDPQMTPDSVLDSPVSPRTWSGGSTNTTATSNGGSAINCKSSLIACTATTEFVKKKMKMKMKKSSCVLMPRVSCRSRCSQAAAAADSINRRKGVPRRSPLNWMCKIKIVVMPSVVLCVVCLEEGNDSWGSFDRDGKLIASPIL